MQCVFTTFGVRGVSKKKIYIEVGYETQEDSEGQALRMKLEVIGEKMKSKG